MSETLNKESIELIKKLWTIMGSSDAKIARFVVKSVKVFSFFLVFGYLAFVQYKISSNFNKLDNLLELEIYSKIFIFGILPLIALLMFFLFFYKKRVRRKINTRFSNINQSIINDAIFSACIKYKD